MGGIRWNQSHLFQISDSRISPLFDLFLFLWTLELDVKSFERPRIVWMESYFAHKIRWDRELWDSIHENRFHVLIVILAQRINWPLENIFIPPLSYLQSSKEIGFFLSQSEGKEIVTPEFTFVSVPTDYYPATSQHFLLLSYSRVCKQKREGKNVFETHLKLIEITRTKIEDWKWKRKTFLKNYMTKIAIEPPGQLPW